MKTRLALAHAFSMIELVIVIIGVNVGRDDRRATDHLYERCRHRGGDQRASHPFSPYIKAIAPLPVVGINKDSTAILVKSKAIETTPDGTSMGDSGGRELARG